MRCGSTHSRSLPRPRTSFASVQRLQRATSTRARASPWPFRIGRMADQSLSIAERKALSDEEYESFRKHFPSVEDITASELHELLERDPDSVVLIDVRTPEERNVSQLPGKVLTPEEFESFKADLKERVAVCYCTAGMRSGKHAAKLQKDGIRVKNLKSSIVAWTQDGFVLVKGDGSGEPTKRVHAFGNQWARQMGDGYELETFNKAKGAIEITRTILPKWLGGNN